MVTQLYTAPLKAYTPKNLGLHAQGGVQKKPQEDLTSTDNHEDRQEQSPGGSLAAVREQSRKGVISIQAVMSDFQSTMEALGVTDEVRAEVAPYLQVVAHQAMKPQPGVGVIKQNLKAAAETLDQFITGALGQNSTVVREWVEALLMQQIDYHSDAPIPLQFPAASDGGVFNVSNTPPPPEGETASPAGQVAGAADPQEGQSQPYARAVDGRAVKQTLQLAKAALQQQDYDTAMGHYQKVLLQVQGHGHPEIEGRVLYQMGRISDRQLKPEDAKSYYQKAHQVLSTTYQPGTHARVHRALGALANESGDLAQAVGHFEAAAQLFGSARDFASHSAVLNQLGILHTRQGQYDEARQVFDKALEQARQHHPGLLADVYSNMATLARRQGKLSQAFSYYKASLHEAQSQNDRTGMRDSLQNMAALYLEAGKPDKAFKALQNALYRV